MVEQALHQPAEELFSNALGSGSDVLYVANPSVDELQTLVELANERSAGTLPTVHVLAEDEVYKGVTHDFWDAARLANLVEADVFTLNIASPRSSYVLTGDAAISLVGSDSPIKIQKEGAALVDDVRAVFDELKANADEFTLHTPSLDRISETMVDEVGADTYEDFMAMVESLDVIANESGCVDEVVLALLAASRNEVQLYELSKWGEYNGLSSKATFSRTKSTLEEAQIVKTGKDRVDVGRPRQRLLLMPQYQGLSPSELVESVVDLV